jgi:hypothetical protein
VIKKVNFYIKFADNWYIFWTGPKAQYARKSTQPFLLYCQTDQIPWGFVMLDNQNDDYLLFIMTLQLFSGSYWWPPSMALAQRWRLHILLSFRGVKCNFLLSKNLCFTLFTDLSVGAPAGTQPPPIHRSGAEHNCWTPDKVDSDQIRSVSLLQFYL